MKLAFTVHFQAAVKVLFRSSTRVPRGLPDVIQCTWPLHGPSLRHSQDQGWYGPYRKSGEARSYR